VPNAGDLLWAAVELPQLDNDERAVMREIAHHYALGDHIEWASTRQHMRDYVFELFMKVTRCFAS
jgi:hypothetical protein